MRVFPMKFRNRNLILLNTVKNLFENLKDLLPLTVRQIFYQVISLPNSPLLNSQKDYSRLGRLLVKARYCGEISFDDIEDRTRHTSNLPTVLDDLMLYYYPEAWNCQPNYVEVFVEKEGLRPFFVRTLQRYFVPVTPIRGFDSLSDVMAAAKRLYKYGERQRHIFVFSDLDPSGECISKDFEFRLKKCLVMLGEEPLLFNEKKKTIEVPRLHIEKVALTQEQVETFELPPKFVKVKDPRATGFIEKYGENAVVELDALPPNILQDIVLETILPCLDEDEVARNLRIRQRVVLEGSNALQALTETEDGDNIGE